MFRGFEEENRLILMAVSLLQLKLYTDNLKERKHWNDLGREKRILLTWILIKYGVWIRLGLIRFKTGSRGGLL
jgi:hypothetical protein